MKKKILFLIFHLFPGAEFDGNYFEFDNGLLIRAIMSSVIVEKRTELAPEITEK